MDSAKETELRRDQRLTFIKRRVFRDRGLDIPVYVTVREKRPAPKLLRKNEKNPAATVDDELGLMAVLDGRNEVRRFIDHLTGAALAAGSFLSLDDITDTLSGGRYGPRSLEGGPSLWLGGPLPGVSGTLRSRPQRTPRGCENHPQIRWMKA